MASIGVYCFAHRVESCRTCYALDPQAYCEVDHSPPIGEFTTGHCAPLNWYANRTPEPQRPYWRSGTSGSHRPANVGPNSRLSPSVARASFDKIWSKQILPSARVINVIVDLKPWPSLSAGRLTRVPWAPDHLDRRGEGGTPFEQRKFSSPTGWLAFETWDDRARIAFAGDRVLPLHSSSANGQRSSDTLRRVSAPASSWGIVAKKSSGASWMILSTPNSNR